MRVGNGSGCNVVSLTQHGSMSVGLSAKEGVVGRLIVLRCVVVGSDDDTDWGGRHSTG